MLHTTPPDPAALARRPDPAGPLAVATPTTRRLADASISRNTRRAYAGALRRLDAWRGPAPLTDAVIASLLFMGGLRRSEVAAVRWADVTDATDGDGVLVTVRTSKTNQEGDAADVRYLKNGPAKAIRTLRAAGIEARVTAHSGRVGLASELTARGASTTEVMLAGNWRTSRMVAHYSAGATAERGAVRKYL